MPESIRDLRNAWRPGDPHVEEALRESEVVRSRLLYDSSNYVFLVDLVHPAHGAGLAVYKPQRGERPLGDFPYGTLHLREVAGLRVRAAARLGARPAHHRREGPEGEGSMQLFIEHNPAEHFFELRDREELHEALIRIAAFDPADEQRRPQGRAHAA